MRYFKVQLDYETSDRAGAGGMFQVVSVEDENGQDCTSVINQGDHYPNLATLAKDIAKAYSLSPSEVVLQED